MQANAGQLDIAGIRPTSATLDQLPTGLVCEAGVDVQAIDLSPGEKITCTGYFTFDQAAFELGPRLFQANFTAETLLAAPAESNVVVVTPQRVATLKAVIHPDTCTASAAAGKVYTLWHLWTYTVIQAWQHHMVVCQRRYQVSQAIQ